MSAAYSPVVVIDANIAIWAILPVLTADVDALEQFVEWRRAGVRLVAPALWLAECVSVVRGCVHAGLISSQEGRLAIDDLFALEVEALPMDEEVCRAAFEWAERLGQARAYDGFYLALAERMGAQMWTADKGLARRAQEMGASWVQVLR
ncbi:MAG TPA: PIN domain-containing protein [Anaerolineales bacterium]|nr:PIN domain-containing protein [Anaerolineae bacterium]HIQ00910.1 PIN domain-containing protein [Anaerolineales bacterium]